jgi:hypothetical protein
MYIEAFHLPFETTHPAAKSLGGTKNDLFVTGAVEAADLRWAWIANLVPPR